jgi:hypothetical protein
MKDPLPVCVGGGGTTVFDESGMLPLARRRASWGISPEGGGAMTEGAGNVSLEFLVVARSGAETGGGTRVAFICTGRLENSRFAVPGAAGITVPASVGVDRVRSRATLGAGATRAGRNDGVIGVRSLDTLGAGGITAKPSAGATRVRSPSIFGAGGINVALKLGAVTA